MRSLSVSLHCNVRKVIFLTSPTVAKGRFIQQSSLLGFAMWEAAGDYEDMLLDAISDGMGIGEDSCQGTMSLGLPL